jgi:hypothetical protein
MYRTPARQRFTLAMVAMLVSTATLALLVLAPLASHGGLA